MTISFRLSSNLGIFSLAFSYPLEPLVFLDNDLLSFGDFLIGFFSGFGASIFFTMYGRCMTKMHFMSRS